MALLTKEILDELNIVKLTPSGRYVTSTGDYIKLPTIIKYMLDSGILVKSTEHAQVHEEARVLLSKTKKSYTYIDDELENIQVNTLMSLIPVINPYNGGNDVVFFNPNSRTIETIGIDTYLAKTGKYESKAELYANASIAIVGFFPRNREDFFEIIEDGNPKLALNLYRRPKWMDIPPTNSSEVPNRLKILLNNLFPHEEDLEYVYCWMYYALVSRNETFLCLIGSLGIGKDFFAMLMGQGVGMKFYQKVDNSFIDDKFNSQMKNARIIFYDEITADSKERLNRIKQLANKTTSIQLKGQDAYTAINESSGIMASNDLDAILISPQDRRFSVPRLGSRNLLLTMADHLGSKDEAQKELNYIYDYLSRPETEEPHEDVVNFYHWLMNKFEKEPPKYNNSEPLKTEYFFFLSFSNLSIWQQNIVEYCRENYSKKLIPMKDIYNRLEKEDKLRFPRTPTITKFLFSYKELGMISVGRIVKSMPDKTFTREVVCIELTDEFIEWREQEKGKTPFIEAGSTFESNEDDDGDVDLDSIEIVDSSDLPEVEGDLL